MQKILILGGGDMIGQKLAHHLADHGLNGDREIAVTLFDMGFPPEGAAGVQVIGNITDTALVTKLLAQRPDVIFHLASVVSGEAEQDYAKGWAVNMMPHWLMMEDLRAQHEASGGTYRPKMVFTSSIAVFGGPYPDKIGDEFPCGWHPPASTRKSPFARHSWSAARLEIHRRSCPDKAHQTPRWTR